MHQTLPGARRTMFNPHEHAMPLENNARDTPRRAFCRASCHAPAVLPTHLLRPIRRSRRVANYNNASTCAFRKACGDFRPPQRFSSQQMRGKIRHPSTSHKEHARNMQVASRPQHQKQHDPEGTHAKGGPCAITVHGPPSITYAQRPAQAAARRRNLARDQENANAPMAGHSP